MSVLTRDKIWLDPGRENWIQFDAENSRFGFYVSGALIAWINATEVDVDGLSIGGTSVTATAAEINAAADVSARHVAVTDASTYTVLAADSGKTHVVPDLTADCTFTMPTAAAGLEYTFIYGGVAADAQDWIFDLTTPSANVFQGGIVHLDDDAGSGGDEVVSVAPNGSSNDFFRVLVPQSGTHVHMICDGTDWVVSGFVVSATAPTFADT